MLNIYYAPESVDKEKFIFDNIKNTKGSILLIVPDQFSAQMEKNAFFYLGKKATMELRILHFERLGFKAIKEVGRPVPPLIDKYGRHMLLGNIIRNEEKKNNLSTYKGMSEKNTFITLVANIISEMKRNNIEVEHIQEAAARLDDNTYLKRKLKDISYIYGEYEEAINNKYLDTEDYIDFYGDAIMDAPLVMGAQVWIYGFDTFTPKNIQVIMRILQGAENVNLVMNYEGSYRSRENQDADIKNNFDGGFAASDDRDSLFSVTGYYINQIKAAAEDMAITAKVMPVEGYKKKSIWSDEAEISSKVKLVAASSGYHEAEAAAEYILGLVRDENYRFKDIALICNDMQGVGSLVKQSFDRWGIPSVIDRKRTVMHHPAVGFLIALMDIAVSGIRPEPVMRMIKSGLMDFDTEEIELLENYIATYKIRGYKWKLPFAKIDKTITEEELENINQLREVVAETIDKARESIGKRNTAGEKIQGLYYFLTNEFEIEKRIENIMDKQEAAGLKDAVLETAQSWNTICAIFDQIVEIMGEKKVSNEELKKLLEAGLGEAEIGVVPADGDSVIIGTIERTRLSRNKVMVVVGANEGVLPLENREEGILSEVEIEKLDAMNVKISKTSSMSKGEEELAVYRNLSAPEDRLYLSYSKMSSDGNPSKPSRVFEKILAYVKSLDESYEMGKDIGSSGEFSSYIGGPDATLPYVADAVRNYRDGDDIDSRWKSVIDWYRDRNKSEFSKMRTGLDFTNKGIKLNDDFARALYLGDRDVLEVSASRLEKYSSCPFAHFMTYGIKPEELRKYEIGARETGDIYHECLMRFCEKLKPGKGISINDYSSPWMDIDEGKCREMVTDIIYNDLGNYKDGLISSDAQSGYRAMRIIDVCTKAISVLVRQVQKGHIKSMAFEKKFGPGADIPPISVALGDKKILLKGIIDRMDVLDIGDGDEGVRIIDYKTGNTPIKREYYQSGYKLQLMVYLNAALSSGEELTPAGVFHFYINEMDDSNNNGEAGKESRDARLDKNYKLKGFLLNEENVIRAMDDEFSSDSNVIPVKIKKSGGYSSTAGGKLFTREEFDDLCKAAEDHVERICEEISQGRIEAAPKSEGNISSCTFCQYKSICMFDTSFAGCRMIKV